MCWPTRSRRRPVVRWPAGGGFGRAQLLPVVDAAAVAGGWQTVWTWVQRVGVVAGVVTMAVLWSRTKARQAFVRLNAGGAAIEPRRRKLPKAPKLPKALNLTPEMRTLARWVIRKVLVGKVSVTEAAAQLGVTVEVVEQAREQFLSAVPAVRMLRLIIGAWVGDAIAGGAVDGERPGFTRRQIASGMLVTGAELEAWLVALSQTYGKSRYRPGVRAMLTLMTEGPQPL